MSFCPLNDYCIVLYCNASIPVADGEVTDVLPKTYAASRPAVMAASQRRPLVNSANQRLRQRRDVINAPAALPGNGDDASYAFNSTNDIPVNMNKLISQLSYQVQEQTNNSNNWPK